MQPGLLGQVVFLQFDLSGQFDLQHSFLAAFFEAVLLLPFAYTTTLDITNIATTLNIIFFIFILIYILNLF